MDIARGHTGQTESLAQPLQPAVPGSVPLEEGALELYPEVVWTELLPQSTQRGLIVNSPQGAPAEAHQTFGVLQDGPEWDMRFRRRPRPLARVRVRVREDAAQVGPSPGVLHQQGQVPPIVQVDLGAVDRPQPQGSGGHGELHRTRDRVVVGQSQSAVTQLQGAGNELVGQRGPIEKREGRVAMELDIGHEHMFALT